MSYYVYVIYIYDMIAYYICPIYEDRVINITLCCTWLVTLSVYDQISSFDYPSYDQMPKTQNSHKDTIILIVYYNLNTFEINVTIS